MIMNRASLLFFICLLFLPQDSAFAISLNKGFCEKHGWYRYKGKGCPECRRDVRKKNQGERK